MAIDLFLKDISWNHTRCPLPTAVIPDNPNTFNFGIDTQVLQSKVHSGHKWEGLLALSIGVIVAGITYHIFYSLFLGPLASVPGPFLAKISPFWLMSAVKRARLNHDIQQLHEKYGPVVRLSPNELSFSTIQAQHAIHRPGHLGWSIPGAGVEQGSIFFGKHGTLEAMMGKIVWPAKNLLTVTEPDEHRRLKRAIQPAFTERSLREQEPIQQKHTDEMIATISEAVHITDENHIDLTLPVTHTIWNIISDLSFGHPLPSDQLEKFESLKITFCRLAPILEVLQCILAIPRVNWLCWQILNIISLVFRRWRPVDLVPMATMRHRMERADGQGDFLQALLSCKEKGVHLTQAELVSNASLLVMVGYDTTATSLSALLNLLIRHPNYMSALRNDVRGRYQSMGQMTADSLAKVPLLNACIQESLRLFPPANGKGTSRTATSLSLNEDVVIAGTTIPAGVNVSADMWTIQRSSAYWAEADQFRPERWIENGPSTTWAHDVRSSFAPFLLGPRVCIGRSVALQSMRMVIAKLVWSFDIEMAPGMKYDWERDVSSSYLWTGYKTMAKLSMAEQQREGQGFQFAKPSA